MILYAMILALSFAQTASKSPGADPVNDICEAVFRYMFEHSAPQQLPYSKAFFIAVDNDKDPSDQFIKRFQNHKPEVRKMSQSTYSENGTAIVIDKKTGHIGIRYKVGNVKWINDKEARLEGSFYVAMLFAGGCEYRVVLEKGKWIVKGCEGPVWES